ncbi:nucleotidyltransferase domain-containing protein [Nitrospira sp. Nam80]
MVHSLTRTGTGSVQEEMVRRIVSPEKSILFGSHARGEAGPDSDVDLLVVMQPRESKRE